MQLLGPLLSEDVLAEVDVGHGLVRGAEQQFVELAVRLLDQVVVDDAGRLDVLELVLQLLLVGVLVEDADELYLVFDVLAQFEQEGRLDFFNFLNHCIRHE